MAVLSGDGSIVRTPPSPPPLLATLAFLLTLAPVSSLLAESTFEKPTGNLLEQARTLEKANQYDGAIAAYRAYLNTHPDDDKARAALARVLS